MLRIVIAKKNKNERRPHLKSDVIGDHGFIGSDGGRCSMVMMIINIAKHRSVHGFGIGATINN